MKRTLLSLGLCVLSLSSVGCGKAKGTQQVPDAVRSTLEASSPIPADGTTRSAVQVRVVDAEGAPISGMTVVLDSDRPADVLEGPTDPTNSAGVTTGGLTSLEAGESVLHATVGGIRLEQSATVVFEALAPACEGVPVDFQTDPAHCGDCITHCDAGAHQSASCVAGVCEILCEGGFEDCDQVPSNGCEADLGAASSCGSCGQNCPDALNGVGDCVDPSSGACGMACNAGFGNCDGDPATGCEAALDTPETCGGCGTDCLFPGIVNGVATCADPAAEVCGVDCDVGYADCDGDPSNGCEAGLDSALACGTCQVVCADAAHSSGQCLDFSQGLCGQACDLGFASCDGKLVTGCEADILSDGANCGGCNLFCSPASNASASCSQGACGRSCDAGFADCNQDLGQAAGNGCETDLAQGDCGCRLSLTGSTSSCLVAGSGARTVVWTQLVDSSGAAVTGAVVTFSNAQLSWVGPAQESASQPGSYFREALSGAGTGTELVSVTANAAACGGSQTLKTVSLIQVDPLLDQGVTATGGCAGRDGNLSVKVVSAETGLPLAGAFVELGSVQDLAAFHQSYEAVLAAGPGAAANTALTDGRGMARFYDFGSALDSANMVSAGLSGRAYVSIAGAAASELVLALPGLPAPVAETLLEGDVSGPNYPLENDGVVQSAMVMPTINLDFVSHFNLDLLLENVRPITIQATGFCLAAGQSFNLPGNLHVPDQAEMGACMLSGGTPWSMTPAMGPPIDLIALRADGDIFSLLSLITGGTGSASDLLALMDPTAAGMLGGVATSAPLTGLSIPLTEAASPTMPIDLVGAPLGTVYALALADLDGQNGTGRLFLEGFKLQSAATALNTVVATADPGSTFAGKTDLAVGLSTSSSGSSIVLERGITDRTTPRTLDGFFQLPAAWTLGALFGWADVAGTTPDYHFSRSELMRVTPTGNFSKRQETYWIVFTDNQVRLASGDRGFMLPSLPASAPRAATAGALPPVFGSGRAWSMSAWYLGLHPQAAALDLGHFSFEGQTSLLTRVVSQTVPIP